MIDYVCLKLGKLTDDLLDEGYDDLMRKFITYRALDRIENSTPIVAYPILSKEGGQDATKQLQMAIDELNEIVGYKTASKTEAVPSPEEMMRIIFETEVGAPLIDFDEIVRDMKHG